MSSTSAGTRSFQQWSSKRDVIGALSPAGPGDSLATAFGDVKFVTTRLKVECLLSADRLCMMLPSAGGKRDHRHADRRHEPRHERAYAGVGRLCRQQDVLRAEP